MDRTRDGVNTRFYFVFRRACGTVQNGALAQCEACVMPIEGGRQKCRSPNIRYQLSATTVFQLWRAMTDKPEMIVPCFGAGTFQRKAPLFVSKRFLPRHSHYA
jgi:hypothetical protein